MATAVATAMATAVAAVATAMAAIAAAIATVAAAVMTERHHLAVTADEGDSNDREKHRQTKNNDTVHPQILQLLTGTVSENYKFAVTTTQPRQPTAQRRAATDLC
jgi:acetyl-CoA acetyltransferase